MAGHTRPRPDTVPGWQGRSSPHLSSADRRSRTHRWRNGLAELLALQAEYADLLAALPRQPMRQHPPQKSLKRSLTSTSKLSPTSNRPKAMAATDNHHLRTRISLNPAIPIREGSSKAPNISRPISNRFRSTPVLARTRAVAWQAGGMDCYGCCHFSLRQKLCTHSDRTRRASPPP